MTDIREVVNFSNNLIAAVLTAVGHKLDMTPETLPLLDHYARIFRDVRDSKFGPNQESGMDISLLFGPMAGAYFGQVITKKYACRWHAPRGDYGGWRIQFDHCFLFFNPAAVAMEVFNQRDMVGWSSAFTTKKEDEEWLCSILDEWDMVRPEEYYSFSMRWEILDTVVQKLETAEIFQRGAHGCEAVKVYGPEEYEAYIKALHEADEHF
jgi:hypothetical protein